MTSQSGAEARIGAAGHLYLFLDYDGTLADFAPTPEHVEPDPEVVGLLTALAGQPRIDVAVVSGRKLAHVRKLLPVEGVLLGGTYGIELLMPDGGRIDRLEHGEIRPVLDKIKPQWERLVEGREGFFLEDKEWALALHARFAARGDAETVLDSARRAAAGFASSGRFRLLEGHRFLEIGPTLAHKGRTVEYLLERSPHPGALPVYVGDDDRDEEAFGVIKERGGVAVVVAREPRDTKADLRLESPAEARSWLRGLVMDAGL